MHRIANRKGQPRAPDKARPAPAAKLASTGTGFFVTDDGYFVTNAHVVDGASRVQVMTKKGTLPARVVHRGTINDLALLKVKGTFKAIPVISSRRLLVVIIVVLEARVLAEDLGGRFRKFFQVEVELPRVSCP